LKRDKSIVCHLSTVHVRTDVRVFYKECVTLAIAGYKTHLIVADGKGNDYNQAVIIHDLGRYSSRIKRILLAPALLFLAAVKIPAYVYHFHDPELLPIGLLLKLFTKAKIIYDAHESYPDDMLYKDYLPAWSRIIASRGIKILEDFIACRMDAVITVTDYHAKRFLPINANTFTICNYPLKKEWDFLHSTVVDKKPLSIGYVGNITRKRGISQLLTAIESLDCTLHLAGSYEPLDYRQELCNMPAWHKVVEYGYVSRDIAIEIISSSLVGVMLFLPEPNHINSLSTKVFEYMAGATCVLVSNFQVYEKTIQDQNCGVCVDPFDTIQITETLRQLLDNPTKTVLMGKQGRELAYHKYNWESQQKKLLEAYTKLIDN